MIPTSDAYKDAINARERKIDIFMSIGFGIDNTSADDMSSGVFQGLPMSSLSQITDANYVMTSGLATFEANGIPTAASAGMRVGPIVPADAPLEAGIWSDTISDEDGNMDWTLQMTFGNVHESSLTLFTPEVHILTAEVVFSVNGTETLRKTYNSTSENLSLTDVAKYDSIQITVKKVDQPFMHLRIVELEFGSSVTLSRSVLSGEVSVITEKDRTGLSVPLNELSFSIINNKWVYDYDSPSDTAKAVAVGMPLMLSFRIETESGNKTIQNGRFVIRDVDLKETIASVTANDPRVLFTDVNKEWVLSTSKSIGDAMDEICEELGVSHLCSEAMYSLHAPRDCSFDASSTYMDDLQQIFQLLGLDMVPGYDGILRIDYIQPYATYGNVGLDRMYSFPQKKTDSNPYNYISVHYGEGTDTVDLDLRTDKTVAINQLTVRNDLVMTEAEAQSILTHLVSTINTSEVEVRWAGDPALEVGDLVGFPGRWSDAVARYMSYQEIHFEGGMTAESRCIM